MRIPHTALPAETLRAIVEEFVTREGTEYGAREYSLEEKVAHIMGQVARNEVFIEFDPDSQTCNLVSKDSIQLR